MSISVVDQRAARSAGLTLVGEPLAIDLANTQKLAHVPPLELIPNEAANRAFWRLEAVRVGVPAELPSLERVRALRSVIRSLLDSRVAGTRPELWAVDELNNYAAASPTSPRLVEGWSREVEPSGADAATELLAEVARSAIDVLTGPDAARLHRCAADDCSMLFVATNSSRQWCTAAGCGNRQRVARHADRSRRQVVLETVAR
jgi:predicted RNA-binding Zn ribbon-like protein